MNRLKESWEEELQAGHRWGATEKAEEELAKLRDLWNEAQPLDGSSSMIMKLIISLEICNWKLEESIIALCKAIGEKKPPSIGIGHGQSLTDDRWKRIWAYHLSPKQWLSPHKGINVGFGTLLRICDPSGEVENHVYTLLGDKDELKELYVQRLCLAFDYVTSFFPVDSAQGKSYQVAVSAIKDEIKKHDYDKNILKALELNSVDGRLQPCHHKVLRRFDILISSIGKGKWRGSIPLKGIDGFARADLLEQYLAPIQYWVEGKKKPEGYETSEIFDKIHGLLGESDNSKIFLASLLVSLLRSQQIRACNISEKHLREININDR